MTGSRPPKARPEDPLSGRPELAAIRLADPPESWSALGFHVNGTEIWLGGVRLELGVAGHGIVSWSLRGVGPPASIDGLVTDVEAAAAPSPAAPGKHPNGAAGIDHLVVLTPDFDRTAQELTRAGMPLRRIRRASPNVRQGFRRLGPAILELVEAPQPESGPARFWGLVVIVSDLNALTARLGDRLGAVRPAVQPGRQIVTLRSSAGLAEAVAFMSPEPPLPSATLG